MRINEITQEQKVNIKCLISKCDKGKTVKDTPYLSLILEDATGVLDAKFWNLTNEQIEQYKAGQIVEVFGDSIIHRNAVQLRVRKMVVLEGEDISDYVRLAPMSRTEMEEEVKALMNEITDKEELGSTLIADRMAMSSRQFYRKFKEISNTAPGDLIKSYRMEKAARLLLDEELSIQDVIMEVGISSRSYFYKEFTRRFGMTPKDYREQRKVC